MWYTIDGNKVVVDADAFNKTALEQLNKVRPGLPRVIQLEVVRQWRHWDLNVALAQQGAGNLLRRVKGSQEWRVAAAGRADGYPDPSSPEFSRQVRGLAQETYRATRGHNP